MTRVRLSSLMRCALVSLVGVGLAAGLPGCGRGDNSQHDQQVQTAKNETAEAKKKAEEEKLRREEAERVAREAERSRTRWLIGAALGAGLVSGLLLGVVMTLRTKRDFRRQRATEVAQGQTVPASSGVETHDPA